METYYTSIGVNVPVDLKRLLSAISTSAGIDLSGLVLRAIHEYLAEPHIAETALARVRETFQGEVTCARCGRVTDRFTAQSDDPLVLVCVPPCTGYTDAHGNELRGGDRVVLYPGPEELVIGTVRSIGVDTQWAPLATVQVPGHRLPYTQSTRKLQKVEE